MPYKVNQPNCYSRIQLFSFPDNNGERYPVDEMGECHIRDVSFYMNQYQNWKHIKFVQNTTPYFGWYTCVQDMYSRPYINDMYSFNDICSIWGWVFMADWCRIITTSYWRRGKSNELRIDCYCFLRAASCYHYTKQYGFTLMVFCRGIHRCDRWIPTTNGR